MIFVIYILLLIRLQSSMSSIVKWLPNLSFNLAENYQDKQLPCSKRNVVFPENIEDPIIIDSSISVNRLVLPKDGEIKFNKGTLYIGPDEEDVNCTTTTDSVFSNSREGQWSFANTWSSDRFNEATPDAERIPCYDDIIQFPPDNSYAVVLPFPTQRVKEIRVGELEYKSTSKFASFVEEYNIQNPNDERFYYNQRGDLGVVIDEEDCNKKSGCPCQVAKLEIDCTAKYCPVPACDNPIKPIGHCCFICGGALSFQVDDNFDLQSFKELVKKTVESYDKYSIAFHVGRIPSTVQLVVVEKLGYEGISAAIVNEVSYKMNEGGVGGKLASVSGIPISKRGQGGKIFISMFFVVVIGMAAVYGYYYKLPDIRYPLRGFNAPSVLSRFQRRSSSVVSLTSRRGSVPLGVGTGTGFRNPLYDSRRGRVQVIDSVIEED